MWNGPTRHLNCVHSPPGSSNCLMIKLVYIILPCSGGGVWAVIFFTFTLRGWLIWLLFKGGNDLLNIQSVESCLVQKKNAHKQIVKLTMRRPVLKTYLYNHSNWTLNMDFLTQFLVFLPLQVFSSEHCQGLFCPPLPATRCRSFNTRHCSVPCCPPLVISYIVAQMLLQVKHSGSGSFPWGDSSYLLFLLPPPSSSWEEIHHVFLSAESKRGFLGFHWNEVKFIGVPGELLACAMWCFWRNDQGRCRYNLFVCG